MHITSNNAKIASRSDTERSDMSNKTSNILIDNFENNLEIILRNSPTLQSPYKKLVPSVETMETSDEEDVDYPLPSFTQDTTNLVFNRCTKSDQFYKEFVDLKKYMFDEMINIKSYVVNNSNKTTT